jgi:O-antigen/teichoic acid export membrane protein
MSNVRRGFIITLMSSNGMMVINFIASLFIARLLTPEEIGIFSVAYVFAGLLRTIREMGLGSYLVQETELTPLRIRTAFGISLLISFACAFILLALSAFAGRFYNEPRITDVLNIVAVGFFLVPFGATTMSLLRRDLRFGDIARIDLTSTVAQNACAVLLAWLGFGFMSLAWSALVGILTSVLGVLFYRPAGLPWKPSLSEWRRVLSFSSYVSASSLINFANQSAADLVLGKTLSMTSVAFFNRATGLANIFGTVIYRAISAVSLPHFATLNRDNSSMTESWRHSTSILNTIALPFYAVLAISAPVLIPFLYGDQWAPSVPILQLLCISAAIESPLGIARQVLTAKGEVKILMQLDITNLILKISLLIILSKYGLAYIALAYIATNLLMTAAKTLTLKNKIKFSTKDLITTYQWSLAPLAICSTLAHFSLQANLSQPITLVATAAISLAAWISTCWIGKNPIKTEIKNLLTKT